MSETENRARVFITHDGSGLDFSKAEKFGHLIKMAQGPVDIWRPHVTQQQITKELEANRFDATRDFLLVAGSALAVGFAFSWLTLFADYDKPAAQGGRGVVVKLLIYDAKKAEYVARTVQL